VAKPGRQIARRIAVIGAGWAGCSAATALTEHGHQVSLIEAARTLGGRARRVEIEGVALDNGQHILLGAYTACLSLMRKLEINTTSALLHLPLQMCYPTGTGGMHFVAPKLPAPMHLLVALFRAKGLSLEDKMSLARFSTTARWIEWQLRNDCSVSELLDQFDQTERLCRLMWVPLCIAALNTPPERASAQIFLNVLRDSLGARRAASDMLIPRVDLSSLLPEAAERYLQSKNGKLITGVSIKSMAQNSALRWELEAATDEFALAGEWDAVIVATGPDQAQRLLSNTHAAGTTQALINTQFDYEPITTCYLQYGKELQLPRVFFALEDAPEKQHWGQFVFDRGQLNFAQQGLLAVVVSSSAKALKLGHEELTKAITAQLATCFQMPALLEPVWHQVISEKRATYSCTPGLKRPPNQTGIANLMLAGDYTEGDYPATLEAAVRSGTKAAQELMVNLRSS
jgi:squalene-associated FAD-dependent desaturase